MHNLEIFAQQQLNKTTFIYILFRTVNQQKMVDLENRLNVVEMERDALKVQVSKLNVIQQEKEAVSYAFNSTENCWLWSGALAYL